MKAASDTIFFVITSAMAAPDFPPLLDLEFSGSVSI